MRIPRRNWFLLLSICICCIYLPERASAIAGIDVGVGLLFPQDDYYDIIGSIYADVSGTLSKAPSPFRWRLGGDWAFGTDNSEGMTDEDLRDYMGFNFRASGLICTDRDGKSTFSLYAGGGATVFWYDQTYTSGNDIHWVGNQLYANPHASDSGTETGLHVFAGVKALFFHIEVMHETAEAENIKLGGTWIRAGAWF